MYSNRKLSTQDDCVLAAKIKNIRNLIEKQFFNSNCFVTNRKPGKSEITLRRDNLKWDNLPRETLSSNRQSS